MANTRDVMGEQACLDALVADTLTSFEDDGVTKVGYYCLHGHTALTNVTLGQCKSVETSGLASCTNLEVVDMLGNGTIAGNAFSDDTKLAHLLLRGASKTTLSSTSAFSSTPIGLGNGAIYVPSDLLATYKADTNWKNYFITTLDKYPLSDFSTIEDDWATIISKAEAGTASESYSIGDTKLVDLGTEGKVYARIAAFNADPLASDGTKTAGITFIMKQPLATNTYMNAYSSSSNGDWEHSRLRSYLSTTILPMFPSVLQSAIKEVTKYSDYVASGQSSITHDQVTTDKLWVPSAREVCNGNTTYEQTGPIYSGLFTNDSSRQQEGSWWLRSANTSNMYRIIVSSGYVGYQLSSNNLSVIIGFCI